MQPLPIVCSEKKLELSLAGRGEARCAVVSTKSTGTNLWRPFSASRHSVPIVENSSGASASKATNLWCTSGAMNSWFGSVPVSKIPFKSETRFDINVPHRFELHNYKMPTFCDHCGSLLYGIFRQGLQCQTCHMNVHKRCERNVANTCGVNSKRMAEILSQIGISGYSVKQKKKTSIMTLSERSRTDPLPIHSLSDDQTSSSSKSDECSINGTLHFSMRHPAAAARRDSSSKFTIGEFNFIKVLGKGSFGKVLLAEKTGTDEVYAVKVLRKDIILQDDDVDCTMVEKRVLTLAAKHPFLTALHSCFQTEEFLFFVMEFVGGGDLMFQIQRARKFDEARARFYSAEVTSALQFLHRHGVIYRYNCDRLVRFHRFEIGQHSARCRRACQAGRFWHVQRGYYSGKVDFDILRYARLYRSRDTERERLRRVSGLVGTWGVDVRDDGRPATVRSRQRRRFVRRNSSG
ncbi:calcium-independent protein kinase C [Trichinella spiralis]|uniref:calcium-independent protein kinase C n=1 Tax=Trichinella spiralis TaxID=6334 RepID=UPI0001EFD0F6|nr:calcium-independent protein kinase C [Trichinella spiralis]